MGTTNHVTKLPVRWTGSGTDADIKYVGGKYYMTLKPHVFESGSTTVDFATSHVESVSSPSVTKRVPVLVQYRLRPGRAAMREPRRPRLFLRDLPVLRPRRPNQSNRSWQGAVVRFEARLRQAIFARKEALRRYEIRLRRYEKLLALYNRQQALMRSGVIRYKRVNRRERIADFNPYLRTTAQYYPPVGTKTDHSRYWINHAPSGGVVTVHSQVAYNGLIMPSQNSTHWNWDSLAYVNSYQSVLSAAECRSVAKIYSKMANQEIHLANIIAERRQTLSLLSTFAFDLGRMLISFKRRLLSAESARAAADMTLAFFFGVKPLMNDIYQATKLLADGISVRTGTITLKARSTASDSFAKTTVITNDNGYDNVKHTLKSTVTVSVHYHLEYRVNDEPMAAALHSLGLINPAEIAWEAMPWSFVIDWFFPIGNWLTSLTAGTDLEFVRGVRVQKTKTEKVLTTEYLGVDDQRGAWMRSWSTGVTVSRKIEERKERTVLSSPPSTRLPAFRNPFSFTHLAEALALITQAATGGTRVR